MKKIVILGPESTGKSTLCTQLADHYKTCWCPEFAREYLAERGNNYSYADLLNIAHGQLDLEDTMLTQASNGLYFIDTDMYVMKVWCEMAFEQCHTWILRQIARRRYDLFFLCQTDLPWVQDSLREYPDPAVRNRLYKMYKDILINSGTAWAEISGTDAQRLQMAIGIIDTVFKKR
ncbi:MAG TPA: ATP-binding protein [Flavisolibacter sp.]|nr:ATP-binding protein [Flavisolibacter sp.]